MVRLDCHLSEYFLFQTLWVMFKSRFDKSSRSGYAAFDTHTILDAWANMPANVVPPERNRRQYLSGVLARNEVSRDYTYNRALFERLAQGWYQFNSRLLVRSSDSECNQSWVSVFQPLNLSLIHEFAHENRLLQLEQCFKKAGIRIPVSSISGEEAIVRKAAFDKILKATKEQHQKQWEMEVKRLSEWKEFKRKKAEQNRRYGAEKKSKTETQQQKNEQLMNQQYTIEF
jgi:hypothetical protein